MASALKAAGVDDEAALGNRLRKGGIAIADLELTLSQSGLDSQLTRDQALLRLSKEVNTSAEMDSLLAGVESGLASELILESLEKNGRLTDEYIEYILTGAKPEKGTDDRTAGPRNSDADMVVPRGLGAPEDDAEDDVVVGEQGGIVASILENTPDEGEEDTGLDLEVSIQSASDINSAVDQINEVQEATESVEEKADKVVEVLLEKANIIAPTNEEELSYFKADIEEAIADYGLTLEPAVKDEIIKRAENFSITRTDFKKTPDQIDVGDITAETGINDEDPVSDTRLASAAINVYRAMEDEFPDMSVLQGEEGKQIIKDYLESNNLPINEIVIRMVQMQLPTEE